MECTQESETFIDALLRNLLDVAVTGGGGRV